MLKDLFGLFILVLLVSAPVFAKEQDPFVAGGVTFMDDHEVLSVEIGAEVLPNLNWSIGFNVPFDNGEEEETDFGGGGGSDYCFGTEAWDDCPKCKNPFMNEF